MSSLNLTTFFLSKLPSSNWAAKSTDYFFVNALPFWRGTFLYQMFLHTYQIRAGGGHLPETLFKHESCHNIKYRILQIMMMSRISRFLIQMIMIKIIQMISICIFRHSRINSPFGFASWAIAP